MLPLPMVATSPTQLSLLDLSVLRVLCVKNQLQLRPALSPHFTLKPRRIRTYEKTALNPLESSVSKQRTQNRSE